MTRARPTPPASPLAQRFYLEHHGVLLGPGQRDGETRDLLIERLYEQIYLCDSGDIIFQDDISSLVEHSPHAYRAVCEDYKPIFSFFIKDNFLRPEDKHLIADSFDNNRIINGGFSGRPNRGRRRSHG